MSTSFFSGLLPKELDIENWGKRDVYCICKFAIAVFLRIGYFNIESYMNVRMVSCNGHHEKRSL